MSKYKNIFFDLDRTLWDLEANSKETLIEIFHDSNITKTHNVDFETFFETYTKQNDFMWNQYRQGLLAKEALRIDRFTNSFAQLNVEVDKKTTTFFADQYVKRGPLKNKLHEGAIETLDYLKFNNYRLHIITNGFKEVQFIKLESSKLAPYFEGVITSEMAGHNKPKIEIFNFSLKETMSTREHSIYIGDDFEVDILGAKNAGIDQVYYNFEFKKFEEKPTYEINKLVELKKIF